MQPENPSYRRYSMFSKTLKSCVDPVVRPVLKTQGVAASKLIVEWEAIVGKEMAAYTLPIKLTFAKDKNAQGNLTLACDGAHALTLQHMLPVIIERIACYFGYKAVERISIEQRPITQVPVQKTSLRKQAAKTVDTACIAEVEDAELKSALSELAKTFAGHNIDH